MTTMFGLARWAPYGSVFQLHREIDDLFSRFFGPGRGSASTRESERTVAYESPWWPAVESGVSEGTLWVRVALPGVDPKDVEVSVTENVLTVKGHRKAEHEAKDANYFVREFAYGTFERSLDLPEGVDPGKVNAKFANGMLEITMPAPVAVAPKKIEIQVEGGSSPKAIKAA
jgi:HSP20 family protein